jgi:glycosyltransferase involved in cell wall biosynthesis
MHTRSSVPRLDADLGIGGTAQISVVIPAYNAGAYLRTTLESVLAQSALPGEIIVVDDGSTDDTAAIARSFGARVIVIPNGGPSHARNVGTWAAVGEWIAYLDADDIWAPEKLAVQFDALTCQSQPAFSFTDFRRFDDCGIYVAPSGLRAHPAFRRTVGNMRDAAIIIIAADDKRPVLSDMYFLPSSVLVRRADVLAVGGFDESLDAGEDFEFFLRLFRRVPAIAVMRPLLLYRRHATQLSASAIGIATAEFEVQSRVAAAPARYPSADAKYICGKGFLLHCRIAICDARLGKFDEAICSCKKSLAARRTVRAAAVLIASRIARAAPGRAVFYAARALRRMKPSRNVPAADVSAEGIVPFGLAFVTSCLAKRVVAHTQPLCQLSRLRASFSCMAAILVLRSQCANSRSKRKPLSFVGRR